MAGSTTKPRMVEVEISKLHTAPWNPRRITDRRMEQLKKSLEATPEMLWARPCISLPDGTVIAGNHRLMAAEALGWKKIPTIYYDLDDATAKSWALRDNASYALWEENELAEMVYELASLGQDLDLTGLADADITKMLEAVSSGTNKAKGDEETTPPLPKKPTSRPGDLYTLGQHRLLCGDATKKEDVERLLEGEWAELLVTDPPYNVAYEGKTADALTIKNDDMSQSQFRTFLKAAFTQATAKLVKGGPAYVFTPAGPIQEDFMVSLREGGLEHHQTLIWVKHSMVMGRSDYHYKHEPILYAWRPGAAHRWHGAFDKTSVIDDDLINLNNMSKPQLIDMIKLLRESDGSDVLRVDRPSASREHPTQKPVRLLSHLIRNSSALGEIVFDPFGGSGSTLIACQQLGRKARLLELDSAYCDVIVARWEDYSGLKAKRERRGR